jgi:hypothetical protein
MQETRVIIKTKEIIVQTQITFRGCKKLSSLS